MLIGIGIGLVLATILMSGVKLHYQISDAEVIKRARELNMEFPSNMKVLYDREDVGND